MTSSLSSDHLAQLVPLLGSLARLIAGGSPLSERSLHTLLLGAGMEDNPAALHEIQRWSRLLKAVQQQPTTEQRHATVEALLVRGLPEAPVLLAVASVVGGAVAPAPTPPVESAPVRLHVNVANLDFGTLRSGQGAALELDVQGGPGQVVVESDQLQVTPPQFGAGTTRLRVTVRPLTSGLLWTSLKLMTAGETLEVPVVAQWQATVAPSIAPVTNPVSQQAPPAVGTPPVEARRETNAPRTIPPTDAMPAWVPELVKVPAGPFLMGSSDADRQAQGNEKPQHSLNLPDYWIGKTPITNAQFRPFVDSDGYKNQAYWTAAGWAWRQAEKITEPVYWNDAKWNDPDYPVVGVSWFEAVAYCRWLSKQTGIAFRLPSEAEWEKAARGSNGLIYPWGNTWDASLVNSRESGVQKTMLVGRYPKGASPYGAMDMAGNVLEWCATLWGKTYPYQLEDEWQTAYLEATADARVFRGGSSRYMSTFVRGAYRYDYFPRARFNYLGLRVASHSLVS